MKFASFVTLASLAVCTFAQSIEIGYPQYNTPIRPGDNLTVQVNCPESPTASQQVAIVISLLECPENGPCPSDVLGTTLYVGPYHPQATPQEVPRQNFTVRVPSYFKPSRPAQLAVTHLALVDVSSFPFGLYEIVYMILEVVDSE